MLFCFSFMFVLMFCSESQYYFFGFASCFLVVFFVFVALIFCYFLTLGYPSKNHSQKFGSSENPKIKNAENGHLDKSS